MRTVNLAGRTYLVYWPVERMRFELYGRLPAQRVLIHWACVNEEWS